MPLRFSSFLLLRQQAPAVRGMGCAGSRQAASSPTIVYMERRSRGMAPVCERVLRYGWRWIRVRAVFSTCCFCPQAGAFSARMLTCRTLLMRLPPSRMPAQRCPSLLRAPSRSINHGEPPRRVQAFIIR